MDEHSICARLHSILEGLPFIRYPFDAADLPLNGIYFFYEEGEVCNHGGGRPRITRIGTHRDGNFRSRMQDHYLLGSKPLSINRPKYSDRSIFRKNLGRALLARDGDKYLRVWNIDYMTSKNRREYGNLRDIGKEVEIERIISDRLRSTFSFKYLIVDERRNRMGSEGLESALIGTIASCRICVPSKDWLGNHSPVDKIRHGGLWLVQHLDAPGLTDESFNEVNNAVLSTKIWLKEHLPGRRQ